MPPIGNDVVDLRDPRSVGQSRKARFVRRVFTDEEIEWIHDSPDSDRELWTLWAAKETAFKVVTKLLGTPPIFEHRAFRVHPDPDEHGHWGHVDWASEDRPQQRVTLHLDTHPAGWIHMIGWAHAESPLDPLEAGVLRRSVVPRAEHHLMGDGLPEAGPLRDPVGWARFIEPRFTDREADPIHSLPSALVRLDARAAAAAVLGVDERALELICGEGPKGRRPPRLVYGQELAPLDVSLSHHGRYLAWVLGPKAVSGASPA